MHSAPGAVSGALIADWDIRGIIFILVAGEGFETFERWVMRGQCASKQ
jgi:hypothetical protein